jgi:hypothetical protein
MPADARLATATDAGVVVHYVEEVGTEPALAGLVISVTQQMHVFPASQ